MWERARILPKPQRRLLKSSRREITIPEPQSCGRGYRSSHILRYILKVEPTGFAKELWGGGNKKSRMTPIFFNKWLKLSLTEKIEGEQVLGSGNQKFYLGHAKLNIHIIKQVDCLRASVHLMVPELLLQSCSWFQPYLS